MCHNIDKVFDLQFTFCKRTCFVEDDGRDLICPFKNVSALDYDAERSGNPSANHDCSRCRKPKCTWASNDKRRYAKVESKDELIAFLNLLRQRQAQKVSVCNRKPEHPGQERQKYDSRNKVASNRVCNVLNWRFGSLGSLNESHDLIYSCTVCQLINANEDAATVKNCAAEDLGLRTLDYKL